jgi:phosphopantetheine adenylyltransferase
MESKSRQELEMDYIYEEATHNLSTMLLSSDKEARVLAKTLIHEKVKQLKNANSTNGKESSEA